MQANNLIKVEVFYANAEKQFLQEVEILQGAKAIEAIQQSTVLQQFPEIDLTKNQIGIFSKKINLDTELKAGDRIEIYRPLLIDPKEARKNRARKVAGK
jgi:putative ubiquitin-RnfH superfamily antitoxin RatB of RatAB toxin-antitoxin module